MCLYTNTRPVILLVQLHLKRQRDFWREILRWFVGENRFWTRLFPAISNIYLLWRKNIPVLYALFDGKLSVALSADGMCYRNVMSEKVVRNPKVTSSGAHEAECSHVSQSRALLGYKPNSLFLSVLSHVVAAVKYSWGKELLDALRANSNVAWCPVMQL